LISTKTTQTRTKITILLQKLITISMTTMTITIATRITMILRTLSLITIPTTLPTNRY
jgi:hypothetical protein